jgi:hypothetical protein
MAELQRIEVVGGGWYPMVGNSEVVGVEGAEEARWEPRGGRARREEVRPVTCSA